MDNGVDWEGDRLRTTHKEARTVIDHQIAKLVEIDDKAKDTVRITVILLGILISAQEIATDFIVEGSPLYVGGGALLCSLLVGIYTYKESSLQLGPDRAYTEDLVDDSIEEERWDVDLIKTQAQWIQNNSTVVSLNAFLLLLAQSLLVSGVIVLGAGAIEANTLLWTLVIVLLGIIFAGVVYSFWARFL